MLVNNTSFVLLQTVYAIKIFICGDFEFLSKMYGFSGASGRWALLFSSVKSMATPLSCSSRTRCSEDS